MGGLSLSLLMFAVAFFWLWSIRNFNYKAHGGGTDRRKPGRDFSAEDLSMNLWLPGVTAGEWHSNHHTFPRSSRYDFLPGQIDLSWQCIQGLYKMGIITSYIDNKKDFQSRYLSAKSLTIGSSLSHQGEVGYGRHKETNEPSIVV